MRLAVTPGEPAGIGPDLLIKLAQKPRNVELVAYADPDLLYCRAKQLGLPLLLKEPSGAVTVNARELTVCPHKMSVPAEPGIANIKNAPYILETLRHATSDTLAGTCDAVVTGPINKAVINEAGIPFSGHTEFLADLTQTSQVVMMLATSGLKVALATTHLPLSQVPKTITRTLLIRVLNVLAKDMKTKFGLPKPRIAVCGLNPHAGEHGHIGQEEIDTIIPAIEQCQSRGMHILGPLPADTAFTPHWLNRCDVVLCMYHDQGLPVLKYKGFGAAVNITLGLPIIRTSVDHGTALDLAATGNINTGSLEQAIEYANLMAQQKKLQ